jgi:hypothetical protein
MIEEWDRDINDGGGVRGQMSCIALSSAERRIVDSRRIREAQDETGAGRLLTWW